MPRHLTVVVSQGQSANPAKRKLEEDIVAALLFEKGIEVTVVPHLYDLQPDGTGMLCLQGISGDMVVVSWLYPRAARWILARGGVKGQEGQTLLKPPGADEEDADEEDDEEFENEEPSGEEDADDAESNGTANAAGANRRIYCLDLRSADSPEPFVEEIRRISQEASVQTVDLMGFLGGTPEAGPLNRYLNPAPGNVDHAPSASGNGKPHNDAPQESDAGHEPIRIGEDTGRRWYPVIDFSRCTNCLECLDFCLFGVYGVDRAETILVEQPDNCRKGCPACSRVCPENAIIFPQHKTPAIAGSPDGAAGAFKIDLSKLFGAPEGVDTAVAERDEQLVLAGRDAVGATVGVPKRQSGAEQAPKDDLDNLMDALDEELDI